MPVGTGVWAEGIESGAKDHTILQNYQSSEPNAFWCWCMKYKGQRTASMTNGFSVTIQISHLVA
jgi:hypothetical protein